MLFLIFIIIPAVSLQVVQSLFYNDSRTEHGSCRFRSVRQAEFNWNSPDQSMTESFVLDDIEYKLCRYHVTWDEALVFCSSHKAHLATLDSEEKKALVVEAIAAISSVSEEYWIGAKQIYEEPWKWNSNGMTLSSEDDIISKIPIWYPGIESNNIHCLTIDRSGHNEPIFVPRACNQRRGFICERDNDRTFDNKIRMVAATKIGEQEFRLYAGRTTWAEAVVHCRQEGLQIGQVNTVEEARALAITMLRNRPEGIESVWIGGYTRKDVENIWRWLGSGEKIENNGLWRKDLSESSGNCLLLDRHVCETPVYVESSCDRKRDVLCQKPPKKLPSKTPVPVVVDDCPYWVGFYPLKWLDAKHACESLNATLVVLDSPATISHMMSLMLDNKAELRHIWTNGRRSKTNGQWIWDITGEFIPNFGASFIPWCPDDDYYAKENSCLNLDRENLNSPLVYGLSCREKQTYVCQPYVGDCIFHSTRNLPLDAMINASEDIEEETTFKYPSTLDKYMATLTMSTVTTPFSIVNLNDDVIQTTLHGRNYDLSEFITWKPSESVVEKNSSLRKFSEYLKPFTRFTLPSLPQFGIKIVSATEATTSFSASSSMGIKNIHSDGRKASKDQAKISNVSNSHGPIIPSVFTESTIEKSSRILNTSRPAFTQISPSLRPSKISKISSTSSSIASDYEFGRTKKYSTKTTRGLNSPDTATPIAPEVTFVPKKARPNSKSAVKKRPNFRTTTEATTPYDAIDMEYYNDDKYDKSTNKGVIGDARKSGKSIEYSEDYESISRANSLKKKKSKYTSTANARKNLPMNSNSEEEEEEEEESSEEDTEKSSLPIAAELSKNLESALVTMMKNGLDQRRGQKFAELSSDEDDEADLKLMNVEHITFRPYYAFEGPLVADLPQVLKRRGGNREFQFIGKHVTSEAFEVVNNIQDESKNDLSQLLNNTRRYSNTQQSNPQNRQSNFPISMMGMPPIHPNDPNSMMQLGRYIKNQFDGLQHGADREIEYRKPPMTFPREEMQANSQRRFGPSERPFLRERLRAYPVNREEDIRNKGQQRNKPLKRPELIESDGNYYPPGRRLYPRGNYDVYRSSPKREGRNNEKSIRNERGKLDVSWPDKYVANYYNLDEKRQPVSSINSPASTRIARSFREKTKPRKIEAIEQKIFPDLKLSKLVKEVKIDLDQRMLRRYFEGFARKIGRKSPGVKDDDWKETWRQLLKQMLSVMERMNININGNLMKIRVTSDDRSNKLRISPVNSREPKKSGLVGNGKQRKDLPSNNYTNLVKKNNETLQINSTAVNPKKSMGPPLNNLQSKDSQKVKSEPQIKGTTTDSYRKIDDNRETTTQRSLGKEKMKVPTITNLHINHTKFVDERKMDVEKNNLRSKVSSVNETFVNDSKAQKKSYVVDNHRHKVNEAWRYVPEEIGRNKQRNQDLEGYYNATYAEEFNDKKNDDEEEIVEEEPQSPEDYDRKPIWTPAHRLSKAMELSMLRRFRVNPSNSLRLKNLVTRSVKESAAVRAAKIAETARRNSDYTRVQKIEKMLENLTEEPSVISLRMIMNPDNKSSRILRQSQDPRNPEKNPPSVELHVQFSGKAEPTNAIKRPLRFIDKERRQAMLNRLRERNRNFKRNYLRAAAERRQNETAMSDLRNRKYRNIGSGTKNVLMNEAKAAKEIPNSKHYIATSLGSSDKKNLTNSAENRSKKGGKSHAKDFGLNWAEQASALFADLKESNDNLTLYINMTLGRVGSKPRTGERSKG